MLFMLVYDGEQYPVEAPDMGKAISIWKGWLKEDWGEDYDGTEEAESCALLSDRKVMRVSDVAPSGISTSTMEKILDQAHILVDHVLTVHGGRFVKTEQIHELANLLPYRKPEDTTKGREAEATEEHLSQKEAVQDS